MKKADILIVGAGISGLAAAHCLQRRGWQVLILEAENRLGGRIYTDRWGAYTWDAGAQFLTSRYHNTLTLLKELGMLRDLVRISPRLGILHQWGLHRGNLLNPLYYLAFPGLRWRDKLRLGQLLLASLLTGTAQQSSTEYWSKRDTEELYTWATRFFGHFATENLFGALTSALYFTDTKSQGTALLKHTLVEICTMKFFTLRGGLSRLAEELAKGSEILLGTAVSKIKLKKTGIEVHTKNHDRAFRAKKVLLATPASITLQLLDHPEECLEPEVISLLQETQYSSSRVVALPMSKPIEERLFGVAIAPASQLEIGAVMFERAKDQTRIPDGTDCGVIMTRRLPRDLSDAEHMLDGFREVYPSLLEHVIYQKQYTWQLAVASFPYGRMKKLSQYPGAYAKPPLYLCGDYWLGPSIECAITSGLRAAELMQN